ncbi:MAG: hypothetical protein A2Y57_04375 [Candidatus Woykebacteria bacterium RBG_13_40_7b]|uniref:Sodium/calcium exchanger membrane region domain-containing protein n=1 Tax=Candidatus Woykebacteria bacterium RBG_13_40_7b TaxID=1802594 RepID=A0A1G1W8P2_9BACT|nr:MAG: hypothetical protein A2Y57_04375 [Candidatus Woykebacteria bacterium RBG_13_40_7b]
MSDLIVFLLSLIAIILGAEWLGASAVEVAKKLNIPKVVIGATLVSVATTLPEISVSFFSGIRNEGVIGLGTVLGSPAANLGLILGLVLLFSAARVNKFYFTRTIYIFIFLTAVVVALGLKGNIDKNGGILLITLGLIYLIFEFIISQKEAGLIESLESRFDKIRSFFSRIDTYKILLYFVLGALLLALGGDYLVKSTISLANFFKIPEIVVSLTVIALGTSLPELATAINSVVKKRISLSIGNLAGASIMDFTVALGAGVIFYNAPVSKTLLVIASVALFSIAFIALLGILNKIPSKLAGSGLIFIYLLFILIGVITGS